MDLDEVRRRIDAVDGDIILLLTRRSELVTAAGQLKKDAQGVRDPKRVEEVVRSVREKADAAGLDPEIAGEIYRTVIGCFVRKEMAAFAARTERVSSLDEGFRIRKAEDGDRESITAVFNHYVEQGFAAYPEQPVDGTFVDFLRKNTYGDAFFVLPSAGNILAGFGFLKRYHANPAFDRAAEVGYFLLPEYTGRGLGTGLLERLEQEARTLGVDTLLANISSLNPASIAFHEKRGFRACGRFRKISRKFGTDVDILWMQKYI